MYEYGEYIALAKRVETRNEFLDFIEALEGALREDKELSQAKFVDFLDGMGTHVSDLSSKVETSWKLFAQIIAKTLLYTDVD